MTCVTFYKEYFIINTAEFIVNLTIPVVTWNSTEDIVILKCFKVVWTLFYNKNFKVNSLKFILVQYSGYFNLNNSTLNENFIINTTGFIVILKFPV